MAYNTELEERLQILLQGRDGFTVKKMFGGVAFMLDDKMCVGITGDNLMVRINPDEENEYLKKPHVKAMDFTGRPMRGFLYVKAPGFKTDAALEEWVDRSIAYVLTIKKKTKKKILKKKQ